MEIIDVGQVALFGSLISFIILFVLAIIVGNRLGAKHKKNEKESFPVEARVGMKTADIPETKISVEDEFYRACATNNPDIIWNWVMENCTFKYGEKEK